MTEPSRPEPRYLPADLVLSEMAGFGHYPLPIMTVGRASIPAGLGNIAGGTLLVALPFWYVFRCSDHD